MPDDTSADRLLDHFDVELTQHQRLLRLELGAPAGLLPHRLVGEEAVSAPFRYRLDCLCQRGDLELKHLIGAPARLAIRQADASERPLHALVAEAARLGEDGGLSTYQLTLVPWLSMLALGRGSRIFQDRSVPGIATAVFDAHTLARGRYRFELRRDYPARSYCVQYRESDLHFISRLFEEEGLFYYFVHGGEAGHTLVVTDDVDTCPAVEPATIRFHRQGPTETRDTLTQWGGRRRAQPTRVSLATFDYKQPSLARRTVLDTAHERGNAPAAEHYDYAGTYYYRGFERGGRLAANRLEAFDARARRFHGTGGARQLLAGHRFELTEHPLHDTGGEAERHFLVLALSVHAENALPVSPALHALPGSLQPDIDAARRAHGLEAHGDEREDYRSAGTGHYLVSLEAQRAHIPYRPALEHPRPVLAGPQTATVVGPEGEEIHTDHLNRVKVRFHWDRLARGDERDSCWLRVAEPSAGAGWGAVFTPRVGQEVLVDFLDADPDRPLITARVFNAATPPPWHSNGLLSGLRSRAYRASGHNELVFDDATGQQRLRLASDHAASQLNLGYLIHQRDNHRGALRGNGFELRSDAFGAVRANQGLYLTTWGQPGAGGDQLDLTPAREQLASAHRLAERLSGSATAHRAEALEAHTDLQRAGEDAEHAYGNSEQVSAGGDQSSARRASETGGRGETPGLRAPWLHLASPAGITATTPASTHLAQGGALSVSSGEDVNIATGGSLVAAITRRLSLFVQRAGIKLFAARGNVDIHAHTGAIGIAAEKDVEARASQRKIDLAGAKEIVLTCGGARVRIRNGNIELHAPGRVSINGAQHSFSGPVEQETTTPVLPDDDPGLCPWKGRSAAASGEGGVEE